MTNCPAYLGVTINMRETLEELIRQDLLILCPASFNVTFLAPNDGNDPSKTFDVNFRDSIKTYQVSNVIDAQICLTTLRQYPYTCP